MARRMMRGLVWVGFGVACALALVGLGSTGAKRDVLLAPAVVAAAVAAFTELGEDRRAALVEILLSPWRSRGPKNRG